MRKLFFMTAASLAALIIASRFLMEHKSVPKAMPVLRVAFPSDKPSTFYEPTAIHLAPEYFFLEYIYSPLVELNNQGEMLPAVAESFEWHGNDLYLKIRKNLKTIDGQPITADDVVFSLKRLLIRAGNTHGDFQSLVCGDVHLTSVDQNCPGIVEKGDTVILKAGDRKTFLLPMLTAIDFAIIPRSSVDPRTLKITNYRDTSGPYYVSEDTGEGHIVLKANPYHFDYSSQMPQTVDLVPMNPDDPTASLQAFRENKIDFITTIDGAPPEKVIDFAREQRDATLHTTLNLRSFILAFTERGQTELTREQRILIGKRVKDAFVGAYRNASGYKESWQFFPEFSDGGLNKADLAPLIKEEDDAHGVVPRGLKLTLIRMENPEKYINMFKQILPDAEIREGGVPDFTKYKNPNDMPEMTLGGPDTGFLEDIGLISYSLSAGLFGMTKSQRRQWISEYMSIPDKQTRLRMLRDLHKKALDNAIIIPLMTAPYVALIRNNWKMDFPEYYGNSPLWKIRAH